MAQIKGRNRARDFDDILESAPLDFDPEGDDVGDGLNESDVSAEDVDGDGAREHYAVVGKSKLRKPRNVALGPQYQGSRVNRDEIDDEEEDDPFGREFDEEASEDGMSEDASEDGEGVGGADDTSATDFSDEDEDEDEQSRIEPVPQRPNREELLKAVTQDQKSVAASLAQSIKADAEKGRAVKTQKASFDSLLSSRIKLQKALVGTNNIVGTPMEDIRNQLDIASDALNAAETAAFSLWSSLSGLQDELVSARTGEKRKRSSFEATTSIENLWAHTKAQEEATRVHRNAALQRWSTKVRGATALPERGIINKSAKQATIIDAIQEHLSNRDRLLKRAHTPRSCAPLQVAKGVSEDDKLYDDADFYGLLLKELLEQKNQDSIAAANIDLNFNLKREAKAKKNVDTKASKGRKLRYTVHEKLQNFMAPEDRTTWTERQADELFKSLFGRRTGLEEEDLQEEGLADEQDGEVGSLMLFRT